MADTDEAIREARRQGYEEGRKAERTAIVAWLNDWAVQVRMFDEYQSALVEVSLSIADGDHIGDAKKEGE